MVKNKVPGMKNVMVYLPTVYVKISKLLKINMSEILRDALGTHIPMVIDELKKDKELCSALKKDGIDLDKFQNLLLEYESTQYDTFLNALIKDLSKRGR